MAGLFETGTTSHSLPTKNVQWKPISAVIGEWEVEYARFVNYPPLDDNLRSTHDSLTPHNVYYRKRTIGGVWLKTSADDEGAFLKLIPDRSTGFNDVVLAVSLSDDVVEEHYVSKLHFSWPQVTCVSGFPPRGTRAVFISYKDNDDQLKKFALRFSTTKETEKFTSILKKLFKGESSTTIPSVEFESVVSNQSEFVPLNTPSLYKESNTFENPITMDYEVPQIPDNEEIIFHNEAEEILSSFPPSFTSFLMNCCPPVTQGEAKEKAKTSLSENAKLKEEIAKYLKDPSFSDVLIKAEQLMSEFGDDLLI